MGLSFGPSLPLPSCPYCGISRPQVVVHTAIRDLRDPRSGTTQDWVVYNATCCNSLILAEGTESYMGQSDAIKQLHPSTRIAAAEIPGSARAYLQQAIGTLHAPDAAAVMAGSSVDAMLKELGYKEGSVYSRIDKAVADHVLTEAMGKWAHEVRLGANRPRHADEKRPHLTTAEAQQSVEFAEALGHFLFVLSSRVNKGIKDAKVASKPAKPAKAQPIKANVSKAPPPITP